MEPFQLGHYFREPYPYIYLYTYSFICHFMLIFLNCTFFLRYLLEILKIFYMSFYL